MKELVFIDKKITKLPNFEYGTIWKDPVSGHRVGCLDASKIEDVEKLMSGKKTTLAIQDPPYNVKINKEFRRNPLKEYISWSKRWIDNTIEVLDKDSSLYIWLGADIRKGFQPLPDFIIMMRKKPLRTRNFITLRNQRGYGTQKNWMAVRQELLYYIKGEPVFNIEAVYTDIPKKTKGYYKEVKGKLTENIERSKSPTIRAGNVWFDIQQVFYLLEENVEGCFAQKPLKAIDRIIRASSKKGNLIIDFFSHSGSTLLVAEMLQRKCYTMDILPAYCKVTVARLLHYRNTGETGWGRTKILKDGKVLADDKDLLGRQSSFGFI